MQMQLLTSGISASSAVVLPFDDATVATAAAAAATAATTATTATCVVIVLGINLAFWVWFATAFVTSLSSQIRVESLIFINKFSHGFPALLISNEDWNNGWSHNTCSR